MLKTCKLIAFALAFGLSGVVALPGGSDVVFGPGAVAWADDVPVIKVTAKKVKSLTPEDCRERGLTIRECVYGLQAAGWSYPKALFAAEDAYARDALDAAREACQKPKKSAAGKFGLGAGSLCGNEGRLCKAPECSCGNRMYGGGRRGVCGMYRGKR